MSDQHRTRGLTDLVDFLDASPSPWHAVASTVDRLVGFQRLEETDAWVDVPATGYVVRGGAIVAWQMPTTSAPAHAPFRLVGAHTDSPCLRVKPQPRRRRVRLEAARRRGLRRHPQQQLARPGPRGRRSRRRRRRLHVPRERRANRSPGCRSSPSTSIGTSTPRDSCSTPSSTCHRCGERGRRRPASSPTGSAMPPGWIAASVVGAVPLRRAGRDACSAPIASLLAVGPARQPAVVLGGGDGARPGRPDRPRRRDRAERPRGGRLVQRDRRGGSVPAERVVAARDRSRRHRRRPAPLVRRLVVRVGRQRPRRPPQLPRAPRTRSPADRERRPGDQGQLQPALRDVGGDRRRVPAGVRTRRCAVAGVRLPQQHAVRLDDRADHGHPARHRRPSTSVSPSCRCTRPANSAVPTTRSTSQPRCASSSPADRNGDRAGVGSADARLGEVEQPLQLDAQLARSPRGPPGGTRAWTRMLRPSRVRPRSARRSRRTPCADGSSSRARGITRAEPPMPTGMIGTPALRRDVGRAVEQRMHDAGRPCVRPRGTAPAVRRSRGSGCSGMSASRSAWPRLTGNAPSADTNHPMLGYFHISCLPMNRIRRVRDARADRRVDVAAMDRRERCRPRSRGDAHGPRSACA